MPASPRTAQRIVSAIIRSWRRLTSAEYATKREYVVVRMSISSNMFQFQVNDRKSEQHIHEPHDDAVGPTAAVGCDQTERAAGQKGNENGRTEDRRRTEHARRLGRFAAIGQIRRAGIGAEGVAQRNAVEEHPDASACQGH